MKTNKGVWAGALGGGGGAFVNRAVKTGFTGSDI